MGESTDGVVESVSKMQEKIKALTGVNILTDSGAYKETYQILYEIGQVWNSLENLDKSALLELMAGKNRANTLAAILNNMEDLEGAYNDALKAEGSAMRENEAYLDSIQGRVDLFNNSVQTMWMNFIDSDVVKFIVDVGTGLVKLVDQFGILKTLLMTIGTITIKKNFGDTFFAKTDIDGNKAKLQANIRSAQDKFLATGSQEDLDALNKAREIARAYDDELKKVNITQKQTSEAGVTMGTKIKAGFEKAKIGAAALWQQLKQIAVSMAISYAITTALDLLAKGIRAVTDYFNGLDDSWEALNEKYQDASSELSNCESELRSLESELDTTNDKIDELMSQGALSFVEQEELERLQAVSAELERQISATQTLRSSLQKGANDAAIDAGTAYLNTSFMSEKSKTERQKEAEEEGKTWGSLFGLAAGAVIGGLLAPATGGLSLAASIGVGAGIGSAGLGTIGGIFNSAVEGNAYDQEQTVEQAIATMNESRDKLIEARNKAHEAYVSDPTSDDKLKEYQDASNALSTYDATMANHISNMSQYYNTIMSNWNNASKQQKEDMKEQIQDARKYGDMIDKYNIMMGGKDAKVNAINRIFGAEASSEIQAAKKELEEMAKAGENIDLKKAFGDNTEAYNAFVDRLYDMGIYVYECEDAFKKMHEAEVAAAEVSFSDVAKDVKGVTDAVLGLKNAFEEFLENGNVSAETILGLEAYFNTDTLSEQYEEYIKTMTSGNTSIEEAMEATRSLVQSYLNEQISVGELTQDQKAVYVTLLKELGITNAEEFIDNELQRTGVDKLEDHLNTYIENRSENIKSPIFTDELANVDGVQEIIDKYGIESELLNDIIDKLREKQQLESNVEVAQNDLNAYNAFMEGMEGDDEQKGYRALKEEYENAQKKYLDLQSEIASYSDDVKNFNKNDWYMDTYRGVYTKKGHYTTTMSDEEYKELVEQHKVYQSYADAARDASLEYSKAREEYFKIVSLGKDEGYLNDDGTLKEGIDKEAFEQAYTDAQDALKEAENEIYEPLDPVELEIEFLTKPVVNTISGLTEAFEQYKVALEAVNEISFDGQQISEDYYNTLREQLQGVTVGTEDFFDAIDTSNGYVVKNVALLKKLTAESKRVQQRNVKLAKSQARLQYYELYKEMQKYIGAEGKVVAGKQNEIIALYQEMNALEKSIAKYSRLETQLLGAANAYDEFVKAQETDSESDYISSAEDMVTALGQAFNTAELGTETAQAAIMGLVPEGVYADLDTLDEKMAAIYDYFKNGKIAQYFDLEFDDDGAITSVEMKLGNLRKFIEDGLSGDANDGGINVFEGTDWQHFEFSESFLDGLEDANDKLQYFADQMGVTKEVAFAFIESINDHDIEWLNGDYSSMFDVLTPETLENSIYSTVQVVSDLNAQLASGKISVEDYQKSMFGLNGQLNSGAITQDKYDSEVASLDAQLKNGAITVQEYTRALMGLSGQEEVLAENARTDALSLAENSTMLAEYQEQLQAYYKQLETGVDEEGNAIDPEEVKRNINDISGWITELTKQLAKLEEPTEVTLQFAIDDIQKDLDDIEDEIGDVIEGTHYKLNIETGQYEVILNEEDPNYQKVVQFVNYLNQQHTLEVLMGEGTPNVVSTLQGINDTLTNIQKLLETKFGLQVDTGGAVTAVSTFQSLWDGIKDKSVTLWANIKDGIQSFFTRTPDEGDGEVAGVNGTAHVGGTGFSSGTAHKSGDWGLPTSEHNALVGELGPELVVNPQTGRYYTVGDNGAEMVDLPRGAIIFNHKQTESLLKNGYVTSRGKAYAEGNAHVTIWPDGSSQDQWNGTGYDSWDDPTYNLQDALDSASDSVGEFEETLDWIAIRMEEYSERIDQLSAELENQVGYVNQNNKIQEIIDVNNLMLPELELAKDYYNQKAESYLVGLDEELANAARYGQIAISEYTKEEDEKTIEAINKYREYAQLAAEKERELEETRTEIADLSKQKFDNAATQYENEIGLIENVNEQLEAQVSLMEDSGYVAATTYYEHMRDNTMEIQAALKEEKNTLQSVLDAEVAAGRIEVESDRWYEMVNAIYEVDASIDECTNSLESYQNAINDIYWDNFDALVNRIDYLKDETQSIIDLMDSDDIVAEPEKRKYNNGTVEYWTADDVEWTEEGIASMGLYAQQMEIAEYQSKQYAKAIDDLNKDYKAGKYSENEYYEKLNELKDAQYENIEAYYDAQEAIKDLNETRIDSIKEGIEKEIEAYEELIEKKREELDAEKDLYDFQKSTMEQQKNIGDIRRKIAALSGNNSMSAIAQRKKLQAELAEAEQELQDSYYDRSIENRQNALDKELEDFQDEKNAEIEKWEEYLTNVEQVVADSLGIVQANATEIGATLTEKANEYNLTISDAVLSPWQDGAIAISDYQTTFDTAMSSTWDQLEAIRLKWQEIIDKMAEAAGQEIKAQEQENANYAVATETPETTPNQPADNNNGDQQKAIAVGGKIDASGAKIYQWDGGEGYNQYYSKDPVYTVLATRGDWVQVRHHSLSSGVTGWFRKSDVKAYAKGSTGVDKDQWSLLHELGDELVFAAGPNGKLQYVTKGTAIIPHDISENLMQLGQLDPSEVLNRNKPQITPSKSIVNNTMEIAVDASVGTLIHVEHLDGNNPDEVVKIVDKAWDKKMQTLNNSIKKFVR
jgi:hypothetical protein